MDRNPALSIRDSEIARLIGEEQRLEIDRPRLIPGENFVSCAAVEASSNPTNEYREGQPARRYYRDQEATDSADERATGRANAALNRLRPEVTDLRLGFRPPGISPEYRA